MKSGKSLLCLSLTEDTLEKNETLAGRYAGLVDLVELRADFLEESELRYLDRFKAPVGIGSILTVRRERDGGRFRGEEEARLKILENGTGGTYQFIDLESDLGESGRDKRLIEKAGRKGIRVIRSMHIFDSFPGDILSLIGRLSGRKGELPKLALHLASSEEQLRFIEAAKKLRGREKILIGMGDYGVPLRILSSKLGSYLTFTSVRKDGAAPGHISVEEMTGLYDYHGIGEKTGVFGVIGNPVMHTKSPYIHNSGLRELGIDAVYLPFVADDLKIFLKSADSLGISGLSVTVPFKERVIPLLDEVDESVTFIGACNTIFRDGNGWAGTNTDWEGFLAPLDRLLGGDSENFLAGSRVTVIGAGGAARAVVYALKKRGAEVLILNRSADRARRLSKEFGCSFDGLSPEGIKRIYNFNDIIVQATTVGMAPHEGKNPIEGYAFKGDEIAYDLVYKPENTAFLEEARKAGCRTVKGKEMLLAQAKIQFKIFTGRDFPFSDLPL